MKNYYAGLGGTERKPQCFLRPRQAVIIVYLLNLIYFIIEFSIAYKIKALSIYADSCDFIEDAVTAIFIFSSMTESSRIITMTGRILSLLLLLPGIAFLVVSVDKFHDPVTPDIFLFNLIGMGSLAVNVTCAYLMRRFRINNNAVTKMGYLTSRNYVIASLALIVAGICTLNWHSTWPDILTGTALFILNFNAAISVRKCICIAS
ncbi:cation diffusion facilitator family transporter [Pantoea sp. At-9b]|uniref:cation diffusion facilitator family transporter n=1 Tax=Pantoea sp. (strain At-9b) TaxID=592316 RepID=UPI0001B400F0|nr:cation diffusion facilitator family transporter [Pantoea sp. At-9b]ADU72171.1 transporter [Pantoea sp. At-9b]